MRAIGGFFELETGLTGTAEYHRGALAVSSGRVAFRLALEQLKPSRVRLPFYSCHSLLEPVLALGLPYEYYALDRNLHPPDFPDMREDDCVVVINCFGLLSGKIRELADRYGPRVVIDNTQAFFDAPMPGVFSFNSARKFFGVPDGSYLFSPVPLTPPALDNDSTSIFHLEERTRGNLPAAYEAFKAHEAEFDTIPRRMSAYSQQILSRLDYPACQRRRRDNFDCYQKVFGPSNALALPGDLSAVPMCYPLLPERPIDRAACHSQGIFIPTLWPEVAGSSHPGFSFERNFATNLLPLPVDHRYGIAKLNAVIEIVKNAMSS